MSIVLRDDIPIRPCRVSTARQVDLHLRDKADALVEELLEAGVIARVDVPPPSGAPQPSSCRNQTAKSVW